LTNRAEFPPVGGVELLKDLRRHLHLLHRHLGLCAAAITPCAFRG
jgi:hypothetical protein